MKKALLSIIIASLTAFGIAQNAGDALRYSKLFTGGSARYMGMGGAFGALGADYSVLSSNPGGIGVYKSSDFSFTPSVHIGAANSQYNGMTGSDNKANFALANAGYVYTKRLTSRENAPGFRYFQFGTGINRINDYNRRFLMQGENLENSLLDTYVEYADGVFYRDIEENYGSQYGFDLYPAWWTYLLDTQDTNSLSYFSPIPYGGTLQRKSVEQWGSMNEWNFSIGGNFEEILYLGMSLNIPWIRYFEQSTYSEVDVADTIYDFDEFRVYDRLETRGTGFNLKFGFILRPADFIRIGGAVHTPSWFNMRDSWDTYMESYFDNGDNYTKGSPYGEYQYKLTTPMRLQGSIAFLFKQYGLISGEYEFVDYSKAKLRASDYGFYDENNNIVNSYGSGHNIKVGTEWRYGQLSFRAGYIYQNSPYLDDINNARLNAYTGGIGYKDKFYYIDLAYVYSKSIEDYYLYGTENIRVNPVENELIDHRIMLTFGTRF